MNILPYILISLLGGAIVPLQLAIVNAFQKTTQASQIQSTFYLYVGGTIASFIISCISMGGVKPPHAEAASWWMWLPEPSRDCRRPKTLRQYPYEKQTIPNRS